MPARDWTDLNKEGRRLESIIKQMHTKYKKCDVDSLKLAYVDRLLKAMHTKHELVKTVLGVDDLLKDGKKMHSINYQD